MLDAPCDYGFTLTVFAIVTWQHKEISVDLGEALGLSMSYFMCCTYHWIPNLFAGFTYLSLYNKVEYFSWHDRARGEVGGGGVGELKSFIIIYLHTSLH